MCDLKTACPAPLKELTSSFYFIFSKKQKTMNMKTLTALTASSPKFQMKFLSREKKRICFNTIPKTKTNRKPNAYPLEGG